MLERVDVVVNIIVAVVCAFTALNGHTYGAISQTAGVGALVELRRIRVRVLVRAYTIIIVTLCCCCTFRGVNDVRCSAAMMRGKTRHMHTHTWTGFYTAS